MDPLTLLAIGSALGLAKSEFSDRPKAERQRKLAATTAKWSPWTGMQPVMPQEPDPLGSAVKYGLTGAVLGQALGGGTEEAADGEFTDATAQDVSNYTPTERGIGNIPQGVMPQSPGAAARFYNPMSPTAAQQGMNPWFLLAKQGLV